MSSLIFEALYYQYRSKKRDAEQLIDFYHDIAAADVDMKEVYEKLNNALEDWLDADTKMGALSVLTGTVPTLLFQRETTHGKAYIEEIFSQEEE
tara:strand:- start:214 stop:495 length:282 start_codon:yes stop_codon:yes gene_type:complete